MKKIIVAAAIIVVLLVLGLGTLASNPPVSCKTALPEGYLEAIESQAKGLYSERLPLVPVYVTVEKFEHGKAFYTIHYFPFGTVGMSYTALDGYGIEKPLSGLQ